jgi:hypothetical protein
VKIIFLLQFIVFFQADSVLPVLWLFMALVVLFSLLFPVLRWNPRPCAC